MLTSAALLMLLHDNAHPYTAACTLALLEHFSWELSDHPPYSPELALSDCLLFTHTYLKNWLGSQLFKNNELMEDVKTWLSLEAEDFFDTGMQNLFPSMTSASILVVITLRNSLSTCIFFVYNIFFPPYCLFC
jgi:hypothetical protein